MENHIRRNQNYLIIIGTGTILFGIWSVIKTVMYLVMRRNEFSDLTEQLPEGNPQLSALIVTGIVLLILTINLLLRLYVGLSAQREGRGEKGNKRYVVLAGYLCFSHLFSLRAEVLSLMQNPKDIATVIASILMDATSFITLLELVHSVYRVRKLIRDYDLAELQRSLTE